MRREGGSGEGPPEEGLAVGVVITDLVDTQRTPRRNHGERDSHCRNLNAVVGLLEVAGLGGG